MTAQVLTAPAAGPLLAVARDLLGPGLAVEGGPLEDWDQPLWPEEAASMTRAVPVRRREFAAGRAAARQALERLGLPPGPLPRDPAGPPRWPPGTTGSLSHGGGQVIAVAGRLGPGLRAVGIDLEPHVPLPDDLAAEICRADEDASRAIRVFGAKEAAYKAQFMLTGVLLEPAAMRITFEEGGFLAEFTTSLHGLAGLRLRGRQEVVGACLLSTVRIGSEARFPM